MSNITTNRIRIEGNVIYLSGNPIGGLIGAFTVFSETITGETGSDYFISKNFRYSLNGIEYSDWQPLTLPNLTAISFGEYDNVLLEFAYTKNLPEGLVSIDQIEIDLSVTVAPILVDAFKNTVFNSLFTSNDPRVLGWTISVLKKIYDRGLLAPFIDRKNREQSIEDFILIWKTISQFFAFYVIYMREYEKFYENKELLTEYLTQRGLIVSPTNTLEELYLMMESFHKQISDRGSIKIIDKKILEGDIIDGEFLRLIQYRRDNEFLFNPHKNHQFGWNLGNSSPLYRGLQLQDNFLKKNLSTDPTTVTYIINSFLDYELTFLVQTEKAITIEVSPFDVDNNAVQIFNGKTGVGASIGIALSNQVLYRDDKQILIRVCLYNQSKGIDSNDTLNINLGNNLVLGETNRTIKIRVKLDNTYQSLEDLDIKCRPLFTPYSHGLIQVYNWISCWIENNNLSLTREEIQAFVRRYLIPYNSVIDIRTINSNYRYDGNQDPITPVDLLLEWRPIQGVCEYITETKEVVWIGNPESAYCEQTEV